MLRAPRRPGKPGEPTGPGSPGRLHDSVHYATRAWLLECEQNVVIGRGVAGRRRTWGRGRRVALVKLDVAAVDRNPLRKVHRVAGGTVIQRDPEGVVATRLSQVPHPDAILEVAEAGDPGDAADVPCPAGVPVLVRRVVRDDHVPGDLIALDVETTPVIDVVAVAPPVAVLYTAMPAEVVPPARHGKRDPGIVRGLHDK